MKLFSKTWILGTFILLPYFLISAQETKYKCMLQMANYNGEKAYIVISLINPTEKYEKTLYVLGNNKKWYDSFKKWYQFYKKSNQKLNAITGASIAGGDRNTTTFSIEDKYIGKGYKIRFESAVEDQKYYEVDLEIPVNLDSITSKTNGKGYIKYVKLNKL